MQQAAAYACNTAPEESSDNTNESSHHQRTYPPSTWNFALLLLLFILSLSLDLLLNSTSIQSTLRTIFTTRSVPHSLETKALPIPSPNPTFSHPETLSNTLQSVEEPINHALKSSQTINSNMVRNIKFVVSAIGLEILGAIALKFLIPSAPITSLLAGLITTRRLRFLAKIKQYLLFLPKIARFEKKFKKLSMTLKTLQKGLKSFYSQQKHEED